jgi:hypothetical protein
MADNPGNLALQSMIDTKEIFEESMKMLGWGAVAINNRTPEGYSDARLHWAWLSWCVSRSATILEVAALADQTGQHLLANMIRALAKANNDSVLQRT